jgi:hypothetical protein
MRLHSILSSSAVLAALGLMIMGGCGGSPLEEEENLYGSTPRDGELNAAPGQEGEVAAGGKITLCHVPPGNPANAHTITVGGPAWNGHRNHKGDYLGPCQGAGGPDGGVPPPPPPPDGEPTPPDAGTPPSTPDAGTPPPPPPPPGPTCAPAGGACGGEVTCCDGLQCSGSTCEPVIN